MSRRSRPPNAGSPPAKAVDAAGSAPGHGARLGLRVAAEIEAQVATPLSPGLYLVATPIGHLADITLRALAVLARADRVFCEDTRQTLKLFARYGLERRLDTYHEHNAERERPRILADLEAGHSVAIVSDAGTPLVSDPGFKLVRAAIEAGHEVVAIPGASATLTALSIAGLPTDSFHFAGFLPPKATARRARIAALASIDATLVLFEAPSRLAEALADLAAGLGERPGVVARELTKLHEEARRGSLSQLAAIYAAEPAKGEIVIVVGAAPAREVPDEEISSALTTELDQASLRDAATAVASRLGVARSRVYDLAVRLKRERDGSEDG